MGDYDSKVILSIPLTSVVLRLSGLKYLTFMAIGMALLWPWNCFLSASEYYTERFSSKPALANTYSSTMMTISTLTSTLFNLYLSQRQRDVDYAARVRLGQWLQLGVFALMALSCALGDDVVPVILFIFVMANVCISAAGTCYSQVGCMALVNVMKPIYANAVVVGSAVAGVLPSVALIVSTLSVNTQDVDPGRGKALAAYFFTACAVSGIALAMFRVMNNYDALKPEEAISGTSYIPLAEEEVDAPVEQDDAFKRVAEPQLDEYVPFGVLWSKLKLLVLTIFSTFAISLIFPVYASSIESVNSGSHPGTAIYSKQVFIPLAFLVWNIGDLAGRVACSYPLFVLSSQRKMIAYSLLRLLFIPCFYCCNIKDKGAIFIFNSDCVYMLTQLFFGFSNGQLYSSCFMSVTKYVETEAEKKAASGFTAVFLSCGLAFGSLASYAFVALIY